MNVRQQTIDGVVSSLGTPRQFGIAYNRLVDAGIELTEAEYEESFRRLFPEVNRRRELFTKEKPVTELSRAEKAKIVEEVLRKIGPNKTYTEAVPEFQARGYVPPDPVYYQRRRKLFNLPSSRPSKDKSARATKPAPVLKPAAQEVVDTLSANGDGMLEAMRGIRAALAWAGDWPRLMAFMKALEEVCHP